MVGPIRIRWDWSGAETRGKLVPRSPQTITSDQLVITGVYICARKGCVTNAGGGCWGSHVYFYIGQSTYLTPKVLQRLRHR